MLHLTSSLVNVMVSDMDQAIAFYQQKLGLELTNRYGDHYAEIRAADLRIGLHPSPEVRTGNNMSIGFGVRGFDTVVKDLSSLGISFAVTGEGGRRLAHFQDPDNNQLFLAEVS